MQKNTRSKTACGIFRFALVLAIACTTLSATPLLAQRDAKIPDSDPEVERKSFIVAPGFEVNLYAADPLLAKPIQMNWDAKGRLWVATSETYPQILPGQKANDKIIILEDTNNDGVADKTTVFADGLLIPTGIEPGDGGAYVANSTELIHLSASTPGGKADRKKVLLSGFGTEDTHHIIHTFRWGPDGCLYFNQSIYIHSHIETAKGVQRLNAGGIWKYNPKTNNLSIFARGWVNSWGHVFDRQGQSYATDGAGGEGINHVVPGGYYMTSQGPHASRILHGLNPGSPKHCGIEIVSGRHFPDDWQGDMITNDFRGHRVCRFKLSEDGSTYSSREMPELIKTNHPAFRPIDVKMGPDGAIYVADWYNPIIQHGEVDFRDPRRDKTHGRIWRITAKGKPLVAKPDLVNASVDQLKAQLNAPELWTVQQAKNRLRELNALEQKNVKNIDQLKIDINSDNPRQRMYAVRDTVINPSARMAEVAMLALDHPIDSTLDYALWLTMRELEPYWLSAFQKGEVTFGNDPKKIAFAMKASSSPDAIKSLVKMLTQENLPEKNRLEIAKIIARVGNGDDLGEVFKNKYRDMETINLIEESLRSRKLAVNNLKSWDDLPQLFTIPDVKKQAYKIAGLIKQESQRETISAIAQNNKIAPDERKAAIDSLLYFSGDKSKGIFLEMAKSQSKDRSLAIEALIQLDQKTAEKLLTESLDHVDLSTTTALMISRKGGAGSMVNIFKGKTISTDEAKILLSKLRTSGINDAGLVNAIKVAGKLNNAVAKYPTADEIRKLTDDVLAKGNAAEGEKVYRRGEMQCIKCHAIGGVGGLVGPDMTSIGASAQPDYLVESLLNPNAKVKEGYNAIQIITANGTQHQGIKLREADGNLVLRNAENKEESIRLDSIDEKKEMRSLMPDGLTESLTTQEFLDLTRFLAELGKIGGPYAPSTKRFIRNWEFVEATGNNAERMRRTRSTIAAEKENGLTWQPMISMVNGELPISEVPQFMVWANTANQSSIRNILNVSKPGAVKLKLNSVDGLSLFVDGKAVEIKIENDLTLPAGEVSIVFMIDRSKREGNLLVELVDVPR